MQLVIGNKRYSTWSLRPWLLMRTLGLHFEERQLPYHHHDWHQRVRALGGVATVPLLIDGALVVSDSLAITEYLHERYPAAGVWPAESTARAQARSLAAEMHAGFSALRSECSMDLLREPAPRPLSQAGQRELARVDALFSAAADGAFLFGTFSAADAMYAPVCQRIRIYRLATSERAAAYAQRVLDLPAMREWADGAQAEREWPPTQPGGAPWP